MVFSGKYILKQRGASIVVDMTNVLHICHVSRNFHLPSFFSYINQTKYIIKSMLNYGHSCLFFYVANRFRNKQLSYVNSFGAI